MHSAALQARVQHVYDFAVLERLPEGPTSLKVTAKRLLSGPTLSSGKSSTVGAVLCGSHIICTLGWQTQGSGAKPHTHPNEQFNYILQGTMVGDIEGDRVFAPKGTILHTPGMAVHTGLACPDEDLVFLAIKDARHGIIGPPVDGKYDGPNFLSGFGTRAAEPKQTTAQLIAAARDLPPGPGRRYVYDMAPDASAAVGLTSAAMTPGPQLGLPTGVTGNLLVGELLQVGVLRLAPGARITRHTHQNEQFTFVVEGELDAELEDEPMRVDERCMLHVPAGMAHALLAPRGAVVVIAQDKRASYTA